MIQQLLDRLAELPTALLYLVLAVFAAVENIFPPVPADTVAAFGSFLAARGNGSAIGAFLATWIGNVGGAMLMYWVGRRYGAEKLEQRFGGGGARAKVQALYERYGIGALFVSRFLPGVRAIVPPFAGALRLSPVTSALAIGGASAIWYGLIVWLAFTVGDDWEALQTRLAGYGRVITIAAVVIALVGVAIWLVRRRRR